MLHDVVEHPIRAFRQPAGPSNFVVELIQLVVAMIETLRHRSEFALPHAVHAPPRIHLA